MKFNFNNQLNPMPKVAVTLPGKNREEIRKKALKLLDHHVDVIEWRADTLLDDEEGQRDRFDISYMKDILSDFDGISVPLIFSLRSSNEGGFFDMTSDYDDILEEIIETGLIDYIDIEFETSKRFAELVEKAHSKGIDVIGSYHNYRETPGEKALLSKMSEIEDAGADIVLVACMPREFDDVRCMTKLPESFHEKYPDRHVISISLGLMGQSTRLYCEKNKQCMTYACIDEAISPGQISYIEMRDYIDQIHEMLSADPITHNIYMCGFMGTGKTTTSKVLSDKIHLPVFEMDDILVSKFRIPISDYFDSYGEDSFRREESALLKLISENGPAIVSTGGGVCLKKENIEVMKETGSVVVLCATPETIRERTKDDFTRPLLKPSENNSDDMELFLPSNSLMFEKEMISRIDVMMKKREAAYKAAGDLFVQTDDKIQEYVADEIIGIR